VTTDRDVDGEKLRAYLADAKQRVEAVQQRLRANDARLRSLETGKPVGDVGWEDSRKRADQLIAAVTALEVGLRAFDTPGLDESATRELLAAMPEFDRADLESIAARGAKAEFGAVNMMQGYLGEERALNAINSGAVPVPDGRYATLAESSNQPAYDLRLLSEDGAPDLVAQVKISDSAAIIREHFARYPDINIVYTNSEAAQAMVGDPNITVLHPGDAFPDDAGRYVVDLGFTKDSIRSGAENLMHGADAAGSADGVNFGDQLQENIPWIALMVIGGRAAYEYLDTDASVPDIVRAARKRIMQTMVASGASTATTVLSGEPLLGTVVGFGTLFGSRAVGQAREDVRFAADRLRRMGTTLQRIRQLGSAATPA